MSEQKGTQWLEEPADMKQASKKLGMSYRALLTFLKRIPDDIEVCEWRGRKRVFYPEHIEQLRKEITWLSKNPMSQFGMKKQGRGKSTSMSKGKEFAAALEFVAKA